ncbi:EscF/YscF/HrpA family type III secretion system needle major subunit [Candidatus Sororendozoicomonas aggregata]|uniref:EscF/YscF/HrpA family type III secretion system needle major subunit n=1 Tax=Candidatus Sororendozoicomonas aggregata TaxID=3073239 RepID=UPI002ED1DE3E
MHEYNATLNTGPASQPGSRDGFNFDTVQKQFGEQSKLLDEQLKERIDGMDPNSTQDMVNFQVQFNKFMVVEGLRAGIIKSIKDTLQSIIQKI